jgi:hypothetical protein
VTISAYQYFELVNLSATGAKLRGSAIPAVGKPALFRLSGLHVLCKVVWAKDDLCGVHFDERLPPRLFAHFCKVGSPAQVGMLTPDEQQAEEEWANGAGS